MEIKIIKDLKECEILWHKFCPKQMIWNEWEICLCFIDGHQPYFIHIKNNNQEGLVPLWYDEELKAYRQFGGTYPENRKFWFPEEWLEEVIEHLPKPMALYELNHESVIKAMENESVKRYFIKESFRYILPIHKYQIINNFLLTFSKKHRYNLLKDIEKCKQKYTFEWTNKYDEILEEFNRKRFGEESDYNDAIFVKHFRKLINYLEENKMLNVLKIYSEEKIVGIEIAIKYKNNNTYILLNGGYDREYSNAGKYLIYLHINKAFEEKFQEMDFLTGEGGWKELWNLDKEQYYTFRLE